MKIFKIGLSLLGLFVVGFLLLLNPVFVLGVMVLLLLILLIFMKVGGK